MYFDKNATNKYLKRRNKLYKATNKYLRQKNES
jgi:hypothetical protein